MKRAIGINFLTIFPAQIRSYLDVGILNRAEKKEIVKYNVVDIRDFSEDKHRKVDDIPYGGGPGMVMMAPVVVKALESVKEPGIRILMSPSGEKFDQSVAEELSGNDITLISGRYTGIDHRVTNFVDRVMSVGDFIVSGGELPSLMLAEAVVRLIPGVLGDEGSLGEDRGYPVYTRPRQFRNLEVPRVLLSGDHKKIEEFRDQEAKNDRDDR
ncbi:MAG: tRNA (guanosine(37)-N1)-methyltransferase TrmD [Elusimicrobia bacterium]|nr:tRNA (guanosine(37)-N1)-methyltransferase TrmD [Elusimicrobiota bacterium]